MSNFQKIGGVAAFINAALSIATLVVAFGLIGFEALTDNRKLAELAINNPTPLFIQDTLKLLSAIIMIMLIIALFNLLKIYTPKLINTATVIGSLAVLCLVINAGLSFFLVSQATNYALISAEISNRLNGIIGLLGMAVIFLNGIWYFLISRSALKHNQFPKPLNNLGIGIGILSLLPPLGILVLLFSIVWSLWSGQVLLKDGCSNRLWH
jgi:hypothetical protein